MAKKIFPIIIVFVIVVVIVLLSAPADETTVITESGDTVKTGVVEQKQIDPPSLEIEVGPNDADEDQVETDPIADDFEQVVVGISVGNRAPNFILEDFEGGVIELASLDKAVVIDFWAGWCPFCIEELPELEAASQEFKNDITFLGIHRTETESVERGARFATDRGVTYPLLKDSTGEVYRTYSGGQPFMPVAYFIDADGIIVERKLGPKTAGQIRSSVEGLLQ